MFTPVHGIVIYIFHSIPDLFHIFDLMVWIMRNENM